MLIRVRFFDFAHTLIDSAQTLQFLAADRLLAVVDAHIGFCDLGQIRVVAGEGQEQPGQIVVRRLRGQPGLTALAGQTGEIGVKILLLRKSVVQEKGI